MSDYLGSCQGTLKTLVEDLHKSYSYVSVLGVDTTGFRYQVNCTGSSVVESSWVERGFVCRVYNGTGYSEYSFSDLNDMDSVKSGIAAAAEDLQSSEAGFGKILYPLIEEEPGTYTFFGEVGTDPGTVSPGDIIGKLTALKDSGLSRGDFVVDFRMIYEYAHISKIFISSRKNLKQSYIWSQGYASPIGRNESVMKYTMRGSSGLAGIELIDDLEKKIEDAVGEVEELLNAERLVPGEYEIICDPSMAGLIAHEAFGHGVEMDMFVKGRAKAVEYIRREVASTKVNMHDGARSAEQVSSYLFDDEGTLGTDTLIIEEGILNTGISDLLSALKLGTVPTGNGKRESFERKALLKND